MVAVDVVEVELEDEAGAAVAGVEPAAGFAKGAVVDIAGFGAAEAEEAGVEPEALAAD